MIGITRADGSEVRMRFIHTQGEMKKGETQKPLYYLHPDRKKERAKAPIRAFTICVLETGDRMNPTTLAAGEAECSMFDNFKKETGRRLALYDALQEGVKSDTIDPSETGMLLASYFNRPRGAATTPTETSTHG